MFCEFPCCSVCEWLTSRTAWLSVRKGAKIQGSVCVCESPPIMQRGFQRLPSPFSPSPLSNFLLDTEHSARRYYYTVLLTAKVNKYVTGLEGVWQAAECQSGRVAECIVIFISSALPAMFVSVQPSLRTSPPEPSIQANSVK